MEELLVRNGAELRIMVPSEVDHYFADGLRARVDRILQTEEIRSLVFDFEKTDFMDSAGIGMLMGRYKLMKALGGSVRAVHVGERIRRILSMSGIHKIILLEKE